MTGQFSRRFAARIKQLRQEQKMTAKHLGTLVGLSERQVYRLESGERKTVTVEEAVSLSKALNIPLEKLVHGL